jgi:hypothetical protein
METGDLLHLTRWDTQVYQFVADEGILKVDYEPMTKSVEDNLVKVFGLDLPVSDHSGSKTIPLRLWYFQ